MKQIKYYPSIIKGVEIKQCSDSAHAYKEHLHQELSIGYIERGSTVLNVNGSDYRMVENEAIIIKPFVTHRCQPQDLENWQFTMLYIQEAYYEGLVFKPSISIKRLSTDELLLLKALTRVLLGKAPSFEKENLLLITLMSLLEDCELEFIFDKNTPTDEVREYIKQHFLEEISLENLEQHFKHNKFGIIRAFKAKFNTTPSAYQLQLRIDYGKGLLQKTSMVSTAALEAGFYDQAHFSKEFKKAYGITPLRYMKAVNL